MGGIGWRLTRSRGSVAAQLPLVICGVLAIVIVLFGKAESSIFDSARARLTDWSAPVLILVRGPVAVMQRWTMGLSSTFSAYEDNLRLRAENEELRRWQDVALALEQRVKRYELLLNAVPNPELPSTTVQVIGQASQPFAKSMILNAGAEQNLKRGQAVLDDRGLLGRIYVTGKRTSWAILLTDLNSRMPVVIQPSNRRAILAGDNGVSPALELDIGDMPIEEGDRVYSTGDGGFVPPQLPIGVVRRNGDGWSVALFADPNLSDYVQVIDYDATIEPPPADVADPPPAAIKRIEPDQAAAQAAGQTDDQTVGQTARATEPVIR